MLARNRARSLALAFVFALWAASDAGSATIGQVDDFEDGTTQGWGVPQLIDDPPANEADGGPQGDGDAWLKITGVGGGLPGSRIAALNSTRWFGAFTGATAIEADLLAPTATSLSIRFVLDTPLACSLATSAVAQVVGNDGWSHFVFPIDAPNLTGSFENGCADVPAALANVQQLRIVHSPEPMASNFPAIAGVLGVDNITLVPEPAATAAALVAIAALNGLHRRLATRRVARRAANRRRAKFID